MSFIFCRNQKRIDSERTDQIKVKYIDYRFVHIDTDCAGLLCKTM